MKWKWWAAVAFLACGAVWCGYAMIRPTDEVILTIGERYEQVRQQSRSTLPEATRYNYINLFVLRPAALRFNDPQYGFATPAAKFLSVFANREGVVELVTMSPQVETLPLDEAMSLLLDLQDQLRRGGWRQIRAKDSAAITDTPAMRAQMRSNDAPQSFWIAGDKYQVSLGVRRFVHENRPADERYLITLQLSGPPFIEDGPAD
ncbi:hypothetical protein SAMN05216345_11557 [Cupriavidus sp. YR651]|uniref:flagellar biosynthesis sigma factor n=1 Tax=Cupriavidus sp. YR651 TaxID=1855315 RepID=UPI000891B1B7|nr:flagellar biosynthesis sigma factor [Cupriavidus sp. YR651]SDD76114.1 hypothetical protein SAMN05216345_11557 [Cupriavidus sp. YR651]